MSIKSIDSYLRKMKIKPDTKITIALLIELMDGFTKESEVNDSGWVSVEDRLPETDDYVLAFERGRICISYYRNAVGGWGGKDLYCTHWQPLPAPPIQSKL